MMIQVKNLPLELYNPYEVLADLPEDFAVEQTGQKVHEKRIYTKEQLLEIKEQGKPDKISKEKLNEIPEAIRIANAEMRKSNEKRSRSLPENSYPLRVYCPRRYTWPYKERDLNGVWRKKSEGIHKEKNFH